MEHLTVIPTAYDERLARKLLCRSHAISPPSTLLRSFDTGRRYRRKDEAGAPFCVTLDFKTVKGDGRVTALERDSTEQKSMLVHEPWPSCRRRSIGIECR